jgi:CheY-like chemotaxis protein
MATILIVDDEPSDVELARRCLRYIEGSRLLEAGSAEEALTLVAAEEPDLVLTDLRMPGMDGLELVQTLRARRPLVPVVLMTSHGSERAAAAALKAGAASYVPKSAFRDELAGTVVDVLEAAEARRARPAVLKHLRRCETAFELANDLDLIPALAAYCRENLERLGFGDESDRTQVSIALIEAVSNAMIHGNLEVGSDLKRTDRDRYEALVRERAGRPPWASRRVRFHAVLTPERIEYVVEDEGPGFDPAGLPDPRAPENLTEASGRGVMSIRTFMDEVAYSAKGSRITMAMRRPAAAVKG